MIDGAGLIRGFAVRIQKTGYKDWTPITGTRVSSCDGGPFIRLDSVELEPTEDRCWAELVSSGKVVWRGYRDDLAVGKIDHAE